MHNKQPPLILRLDFAYGDFTATETAAKHFCSLLCAISSSEMQLQLGVKRLQKGAVKGSISDRKGTWEIRVSQIENINYIVVYGQRKFQIFVFRYEEEAGRCLIHHQLSGFDSANCFGVSIQRTLHTGCGN